MADWDAGYTTQQISRRRDFTHDSVARIVTYYDGTAEHPRFCRQTTEASQRLASAIAVRFPERALA